MSLINEVSGLVRRVGRRVLPKGPESVQSIRCRPWFADNGDRTLRVNYDLTPESVVFDLGGYQGDFASVIFSMYVCTIHVFEPVDTYYEEIKQRFAKNPKIAVYPFGLADADSVQQIHVSGERSSQFGTSGPVKSMKLVKAADFIASTGVTRIDLLKINIEGGEYDLINHLIDTSLIRNVTDLQVQFHDFVPNAESRMAAVQDRLRQTHALTYQYPFVWENWRLKQA